MALLKKHSALLSLSFFTVVVFVIEIMFFYLIEYIHDYLQAMQTISYALLGVGIGSLVSTRINYTSRLFPLSLLGTAVFSAIASTIVIRFPSNPLVNIVLLLPFIFPAIYTSVLYREFKSDKAYLFDMAGAIFGIILVILLFHFFNVESSFFLLIATILFVSLTSIEYRRNAVLFSLIAVLLVIFLSFFFLQQRYDVFNLVHAVRCGERMDQTKIFCRLQPGGARYETHELVGSYDNLVARIDVTRRKGNQNWHGVYFHSMMNDHFRNERGYVFGRGRNLDRRVVTGIFDNPRILIAGPSANGILKSAVGWSDRGIIGVELNPSIVQIMTRDFYEESGRSYDAIQLERGNVISYLARAKGEFDLITFINTRSMTSIGYLGAPDYLHTRESYRLFFDHLSDNGYLMYEERPIGELGMHGVKRQLATLYAVLQEIGANEPERHLFVYSWMGARRLPRAGEVPDYISIMASRSPFGPEQLAAINTWIEWQPHIRPDFLLPSVVDQEYVELFQSLKDGDRTSLPVGVDYSPVTNDRPYSSQVYTDYPEVTRMLLSVGLVCLMALGFLLLFSWRSLSKASARLSIYNVLIGIAFFLIEILLIQKYLNVFLTPIAALVLVLGVMLFSSGLGALFLSRVNPLLVSSLLIVIVIGNVYLPSVILQWELPWIVEYSLFALMIFVCGFFMGGYFPRGLIQAKEIGLRDIVPVYFGICSIAGTFGTILSLYLSVRYGFVVTMVVAFVFYFVASSLVMDKRSRG